MICAQILERLGFECEPLPGEAWRLWTPFTYGDDGELIGLYIEPTSANTWRVTDHANTLFHAATQGVSWTSARLQRLQKSLGAPVDFHHGEIRVPAATIENLPTAVISVLDAVLSASFMERDACPHRERALFTRQLDSLLSQCAGDRLRRNVKVRGGSGHQLEFPYLLLLDHGECYIQPVRVGEGRGDWASVYRTYGKMSDLKDAGAEKSQRCVIVDDSDANKDTLSNVLSFLSASARVYRFSQRADWLPKLIAA